MRKQPTNEQRSIAIVTVLSVSPVAEDHQSLENILQHSKWKLYRADQVSCAWELLRDQRIGVVLCDCDLQGGLWIDLLRDMATVPCAPPLIVTSRNADDRLWSEALNLGAYDVLGKPFRMREVFQSVSLAWLNWRSRHDHSRHDASSNGLAMRAAS
jgi:DNA-binding NtrC family response regulator